MWLGSVEKDAVMTFLFLLLVAILGFLCLSGPDGMIGPKHR